jgi:transcriptional regulator with XRE-family HTH domain
VTDKQVVFQINCESEAIKMTAPKYEFLDWYTAEYISQCRKAKHMTQEQLSLKVGLSQQCISNIEQKWQRSVRMHTLLALINGFDMSYQEFFDGLGKYLDERGDQKPESISR